MRRLLTHWSRVRIPARPITHVNSIAGIFKPRDKFHQNVQTNCGSVNVKLMARGELEDELELGGGLKVERRDERWKWMEVGKIGDE